MKVYHSKVSSLPGSSYVEVLKLVRKEESKIQNLTKRQPYVRSTYFSHDKVFISSFMTHTMQKGRKSRTERLRLYAAAIDLIRKTRNDPETLLKSDLPKLILYRFYGVTRDNIEFCVQIKQDKRTGRKDFMSVFKRSAH
jgi:hypothetical protein